MKIKNILACLMACLMLTNTSVLALDHGAYKVSAETNYWNPDTGEIDDGGTANAALGEGMCRSATGSTALVERDGDKYFVTIRLLLQSNTHSPEFWKRTGYNTYSKVSYQVMSENGIADSVDYRFEVSDPFAPIKVAMYVVPMGREVLWYIELIESSATTDTGDFVVSVKEIVEEKEEPVIEETLEEDLQVEETVKEVKEEIETYDEIEEETEEKNELIDEEENLEEVLLTDEVETDEIEEDYQENLEEEIEELDAVASASFKISDYSTQIVLGLSVFSAIVGFLVYKRKKK